MKFTIRKPSPHIIIVAAIIIIGALFRFYNFDGLLTFYGDHSRDFLTVYKIAHFHEWVWHGPAVSVVWALLSPIYYYLWLPFYLLFNWHPLTQPIIGGIFGLATTTLLFFCFRNLWGIKAGVIIAFLYAISAVVIPENIIGTNPSLVPVGTVIFLWSTLKVLSGEDKYFPISLAALGWAGSFHASGVFLTPVLVILLLIKRPKISRRNWLLAVIAFFVIVVIPYSIQEKKHGGYNLVTMYNYVFAKDKGAQVAVPLIKSLANYSKIILRTPADILAPLPDPQAKVTTILVWVGLLGFIIKYQKKLDGHFRNLLIIATIYTLFFSLAVKFGDCVRPGWWFGNVFFPLVVIIWGYLLTKIKSRWILLGILVIAFTANLYYLHTYENNQSFGRFAQEKQIVNRVLIETDNSFDLKYIYNGVDESGAQGPFAYLFWYFDRPQFQDKYFRWLNWQKPPADFPLYLVFQETSPSGKEDWLNKYNNRSQSLIEQTNFYEIYKVK